MRPAGDPGFTLLEMMLCLAIIAVAAGLSVPVYMRFQQAQNLDGTAEQIVDDLRRAAQYSRDGYFDATWGVHTNTGSVTLFRGSSFASRNAAYDETKALPGSVDISGISDVTFSKIDAQPSTTGAIIVSTAGNTKTIGVHSYGMVDF